MYLCLILKPQLAPLRSQMLEAVTRVLDSTGYILGREVTELEDKVAQLLTGTNYRRRCFFGNRCPVKLL